MKREIKHKCPDDLIYSVKAGKCINTNLRDMSEQETVDGAVDPDSRSRAAPNLTFPSNKRRGDIQKI